MTIGGKPERPPWVREIAIGLAVFAVYAIAAGLDWPGRRATAMAHSRRIFDLERALHIDVEPALNRWLVPHDTLRVIANYEYATTYVISAFALLFWLYLRRPAVYRWARNSFILVNLLSIACFAVYPVAPPRLVGDLGFVDTVRLGHTWGSWGSPMVAHANELAAMPSLHFAWAVWVSAMLAAYAGGRLVQGVSAVHVAVTALVIMATANHYLLDAVAGTLVVVLCVTVTRPRTPPRRGERVAAPDAFFLHVESAAAPQHVGGLAVLDGGDRTDLRDAVEAVVRAHLHELPRFRQRLSAPSRWRRPRWVDHPDLDWAWHVPERRLDGAEGDAALDALVAEIAQTPLPRDRPMWRFFVVSGLAGGRAAAILVVHHVVADGIGTVAQALNLLEPVLPPRAVGPAAGGGRSPGRVRTAFGTAAGLAQLATDGRPASRYPTSDTARRRFGTVELPLDAVRSAAARHGARVSDVLLAAVAGGLRRVLPDPDHAGTRLRVAVPLTVREPGTAAEGNTTAAVMMDLPLGPLPEAERLAGVAAGSRRLRTGTRALASRFVMGRLAGLLPTPAHAWFARTVYGARFFQAIVSNMPGPPIQLSLAGAPVVAAYPILPLAPGAPLAVGALGWHGSLCIGVSADPALVDDAERLAASVGAVIEELRGPVAPTPVAPAADSVTPAGDPAADRSGAAGR
ncbi:phosphatase PAP2 family protein [Phytohabitans sp. ZYX-F-186]|uniref:Phosphatase PAP2 family protein n=1 Tax=Phytohabitans maris TaxID=3071409 RepID=A0ABU0ZH84_9ACTN|nr:phosphatase PAP2 family protein [Phytohabitans sp. ZYX-F-186]MDQ7905769.1 phosphatase PAP2 family protein [Phytohabitans sp. ZYX-F-186]